MSELKIVAVITAKKEYQIDVEKALHNIVDGTRAEAGNISYDLHIDTKNPFRYTIIEVWESQDAINIHNETTHFIAFQAAVKGKLDGVTVDIIKQIY